MRETLWWGFTYILLLHLMPLHHHRPVLLPTTISCFPFISSPRCSSVNFWKRTEKLAPDHANPWPGACQGSSLPQGQVHTSDHCTHLFSLWSLHTPLSSFSCHTLSLSLSPLPLLLLPPSRAPLGCLIPELPSWRWDVVVRGSCVTQSSAAPYSSCCSKHPSLPGVKSKREHGCLSFTLSLASKGLKYSLCWTDTHITERLSRV